MIKEPGPVFCVGGGPKDVHHHEVLDVVLLPPWLFQLVDIVPELLKKSHLIQEMCIFHPVMFRSRDKTDSLATLYIVFWHIITKAIIKNSPRLPSSSTCRSSLSMDHNHNQFTTIIIITTTTMTTTTIIDLP